MEKTMLERYPAQVPTELHQWASRKAKELDVTMAAVWRGLPSMLEEAETMGLALVPVEVEMQHVSTLVRRPREAQA